MCGITSGVDQVLSDSHTEQVTAWVCSLLFVNTLIIKSLKSTPMMAVTISLIQELPMVLVNYYGRNAENEQFKVLIQIKNILDNLEISQYTSVNLGGDFDLFFDKSLDTDDGNPSVKTKSLSKLQKIITENDLCDIFRIRNPQEWRFTWRNKNPFKQRRLDFFLISDFLQELVVDSQFSQSDHSAIVLKLSPTNEGERGRSHWKFNNSLPDDNDFMEGFRQKIQVYFRESSEASTPNARWDYLKYHMRQFSKKFSNDKVKKRKARRLELESKVKEFEEQLTTASNGQLINDYNKCKEELEVLYDNITDEIILRSRVTWYEKGEFSSI